MKYPGFLLLFPIILLLNSCLGLDMDISLNENGSGTIELEYKISRSLEALGRLDGNERWLSIPVGRADFERTLSRLPEMRLLSFSSKEDSVNLIISTKMEFFSIQGLLAFLDAGASRSSFFGNTGSGQIILSLSEGAAIANDTGLLKLLEEISESYSVRFSMSFPREGSLKLTDRQGRDLAAIPGTEIQPRGRRVSSSFPLYSILSSNEGINIELSW